MKEVPIWSENFDDGGKPGTADAAVKRESDGDDAVDVADDDVDLDLSSLTWESVEKFGHANQVSVEEPVRLFLPDRLEFSKAPEGRSFCSTIDAYYFNSRYHVSRTFIVSYVWADCISFRWH